ncbi:inhibitor of apoptosis protein [Alphaentomopoxvirus acuprea]|uniref:Inhibitor of apoptosis protein n=1 Tax=Alphaentomopoxvirus acuprea TaxID=62099 RepID=W6JIV0_9POXV|nr:inhibitor of apoptosis protein [Anomala cuprea entomopoxvirus]BAO49477.1 inhibitor of apoptosis protein [Anomala cuprea entomopoxvirus]
MTDDTVISFESKPVTKYENNETDGFIKTSIRAFSSHHGLIITPDVIWISILAQISLYINYNSQKLRHKFVNFNGKKPLQIIKENAMTNIPELIESFTDLLDEHIIDKKFISWILTAFSTSTNHTKIVKSIMLMGTFKHYFNYCCSECGLSQIIIKGNKDDWIRIRENLLKIKELNYDNNPYNVEKWYNNLYNFITEFINAKENNINITYWEKFVSEVNRSGGPYIYGHILALCEFYVIDNQLKQLKQDYITIDNIPPECVEVKILHINTNQQYSITAGNIGFVLDNSNFSTNINYNIHKHINTPIEYRIKTFDKWNTKLIIKDEIREFAKAGFIYTGKDDIVECVKCKLQLSKWEVTDIPIEEHRRYNPNCDFVK